MRAVACAGRLSPRSLHQYSDVLTRLSLTDVNESVQEEACKVVARLGSQWTERTLTARSPLIRSEPGAAAHPQLSHGQSEGREAHAPREGAAHAAQAVGLRRPSAITLPRSATWYQLALLCCRTSLVNFLEDCFSTNLMHCRK